MKNDFDQEIDGYVSNHQIVQHLKAITFKSCNIKDMIVQAYEYLALNTSLILDQEVELAKNFADYF